MHKIRLVSLKPVVQDIGRAYIKNRHRDEWIPENPVVASFPNNVSRGTALLRLLSLLHRAWLSLSANLLNFSRDFRHEPLPTRVRLPIFIVIRLEYEVNSLSNVG